MPPTPIPLSFPESPRARQCSSLTPQLCATVTSQLGQPPLSPQVLFWSPVVGLSFPLPFKRANFPKEQTSKCLQTQPFSNCLRFFFYKKSNSKLFKRITFKSTVFQRNKLLTISQFKTIDFQLPFRANCLSKQARNCLSIQNNHFSIVFQNKPSSIIFQNSQLPTIFQKTTKTCHLCFKTTDSQLSSK